ALQAFMRKRIMRRNTCSWITLACTALAPSGLARADTASFAAKCAQPGVIHCFPFDEFEEIQHAGWDRNDPVLNAEMVKRGFVYGSQSWLSRSPGEALAWARRAFGGGMMIPEIDRAVFDASGGGSGSLRLDTVTRSGPASCDYLNNFSGMLGD